jgi:hypothetical protein
MRLENDRIKFLLLFNRALKNGLITVQYQNLPNLVYAASLHFS